MRVLVTGATGFIGSHLVQALLDDVYSVRVVVRSQPKRLRTQPWLSNGDVEVFSGDVTRPASINDAVRGIDVVFHLAALLGNRADTASQLSEVNIFGTKVVVDASYEANVRQIVYLSTTGVMGRLKTLPGTLNHPYNPGNEYERSKSEAERYVLKSVEEGRVSATIVRPSHVYGPGEFNTLPIYRLMKRLGILALPNGGNSCFQPLYVTDLARALVLCADKEDKSRNRIYIAAGGEVVTFKEFLKLSAKIMKTDVKILGIPEKLLRCIGVANKKISDATKLPEIVTQSRIEFFHRNHVYDTKPISSDLGWSPKVCLADGLNETIGWYVLNGLL
jgi:nucleoside-diphosphate-sugar epimerase